MTKLPDTPDFGLAGKRALVAGASSGIGLGCAVALARQGAEVVLAARRADLLDQILESFDAEGLQARALPLDVTDTAATQAAVEGQDAFDILVNAAGTARHAPAVETTEADFDAVMAVNTRAAYFLARNVARGLIAAGRPGSIITISSQMGHVGGSERAVYCASKFAVEGFTKAMAVEWGRHHIRVNTICPTFVLTDLTRPTLADPDKRAWIEERIKLGRTGTVGDVAGAAVYLASDAAALVTGTALMADGGWTAD